MDSGGRRFSTVVQLNPETMERVLNRRKQQEQAVDGVGENRRKMTSTFGHLALFKDEENVGNGATANFMSAYTTPGPKERATSEHKKANLGVMLGVYLPTIQHILGVTMFIRLFWVVGMAGLWYTMLLLALCCACTLLTSISLSAVATNGVVESGGAYFMISRNLGVEFGSAVGILFYLANTVATSMYLVGGVEVMLMYLWPEMTIGGPEVHHETELMGMMSHNYRIYGTLFLLLEVLIVAMGVRFVQLLAPVSLVCVILAIFACFAGGVEKAMIGNGQSVCNMEDRLIQSNILFDNFTLAMDHENGTMHRDICGMCRKSHRLTDTFCMRLGQDHKYCTDFTKMRLNCTPGFPGINARTLEENLGAEWMQAGEAFPGVPGMAGVEVVQDVAATFFVLLAIYFPAVTGIMTGTNMSGDLADPQKSIPSGTIAATLTTSIIYYALAILFAASIDRSVLRDKYGRSIDNSMVVATLAWPSPWVVTVGSFLSTFGAALQCLCSAPRLLQSIAKDDVIPALAPFARVTKNNEPFLGLLLTAFIAELAILLGAVDAIAEVLDFFFLMCYAFVNLICFLHSVLKAPNWRPRFKYYHWSLSLMGAFLCFFIMFASQWIYALIACGLTFLIYKYVEWKGAKKEWGDGIRGLALTTAQYSLLKVEDKDPHPKNWRPQLLILLTSTWSKEMIDTRTLSLLNLAGQLKAGRGLAIAIALLKGTTDDPKDKMRAKETKTKLIKDMTTARLKGFGKTMFYNQQQMNGAVSALYQSVGVGGLRPNTVLLNWPSLDKLDEVYLFAEEMINGVMNENCVIVAKGITDFPEITDKLTGTIDIWWVVQDGGILMLIAYLLKQHKVWKGCQLRIFAISETDSNKAKEMRAGLTKYVYMLRIDAEVFIVSLLDEEVAEDVVEKTKEIEEKQRMLRSEIKRSRSREAGMAGMGGVANEAFNNDDTLYGRFNQQARNKIRSSANSLPTVIHINEHEETSFSASPVDDLYGDDAEDDLIPPKEGELKLNVHKMNTSVRLNRVILEHSSESQLILLTLPHPPRSRDSFVHSYLAYLDVLSENLKRVIFIGGSGKEVITVDS